MSVPPKPRQMSEKRYCELYDSEPHCVEGPGFRITTCGVVSAEVIADTYRRQGIEVSVRPVTPPGVEQN